MNDNDIVKEFFKSTAVVRSPIYSVSLEAMDHIVKLMDEKDKRIVELEARIQEMHEEIQEAKEP